MVNSATQVASDGARATPEEIELAELIVSALTLEVRAEDIDPLAALYRDGLGLDSIDILEVALAVSKKYGVKLRADHDDNHKVFSSLRNLNDHIQKQRVR